MLPVNPFLASQLPTLGGVCNALALALWLPLEDGLFLGADWRLDPSHYQMVRRSWSASVAELRAGRRVTLASDVTLLPLLGPAGALLGAVEYVGAFPETGAARVYLDETLGRFADLLAHPVAQESVDEGLLNLVPFDLEGNAEEVEERTYSALLLRCGWDVTLAAAALGIARQSLYERLEELDLIRLRPASLQARGVKD